MVSAALFSAIVHDRTVLCLLNGRQGGPFKPDSGPEIFLDRGLSTLGHGSNLARGSQPANQKYSFFQVKRAISKKL